ncbi:6-phosphogluconolactonase [Steroidobacter cummioxidans]|uniref:6-phosphogluconolactonase n=1 Tax=Steroidobacter cummioxidans TaxID=1803913 RepID=UPI000E321282|nr:6-phosphogluconolactonase [Steroidobacter cummioxidans]
MSSLSKARVEVLADAEALAHHVADWLTTTASAKSGSFSLALSGGSTPRRLYQLLASAPYRERFPWARTHFFWGDERFVPPDHPQSNYRMVREALLAHVPVPSGNIHPVPTEGLTPEASAVSYEEALKSFYGSSTLSQEQPLFDVTFLGIGPEGHIASLFPDSAMLEERTRWVGAVIGVKPEPRITLTYPALESSGEVAFLIAGAEKGPILKRLFAGDQDLPAARLHPVTGPARFFLDRAAAGSVQ